MNFVIHRGAAEIGGSCVEICSASTRIIIDIGMPLMNPDGSAFDSSKINEMSTKDLIKENILPDIPPLFGSTDDKETALLVSHAHQDHYGLMSFVNEKIPVCLGKATHKLIELTSIFAGKESVIENPRYFESYKSFTFGDMEITPYLMDHAAFDAYAFCVRAAGKSLLYTGDFRAHGRKSKLFYKFLHIAPKNVDWLLMEGTSLSREKQHPQAESGLEEQFVKTFKETNGINLVYVSGQNIDRLVTIYRACNRTGKLFIIDFYIATVLSELAALGYGVPRPSSVFQNVKVFFPSRLCKKMEKLNKKDLIKQFEEYKITPKEINENANKIVMTVRPSMDQEIKRIKNLSKGTFIYSMWEGYKNTMSTKKFLSDVENRGATITTLHTSGHADYYTLQKLIAAVEPLELVPIHTTVGNYYKDIFPNSNVKQINNGEVAGICEDKESKKILTLFDHFVEIGKAHEDTGVLSDAGFDKFITKVNSHVNIVCEKLELSEIQAVLFSDFINLYDGHDVSLKDIAEFIGCKPVTVMSYIDEFGALENKSLIHINSRVSREAYDSRLSFYTDMEAVDALKKNSVPGNNVKNLSVDDFLTHISILYERRGQEHIRFTSIIKKMNILLNNNLHLGLVKKLKTYTLPEDVEWMLIVFCYFFVDLNEETIDFDTLRRFYDFYDFKKAKKQLELGNHILQKKELIKNAYNGGFADSESFALTDKAKDELLFELKEQMSSKIIRGITAADSIPFKTMFYPDKTTAHVKELTDLLREENFSSTQKRLSLKGMRTGFACLFSGPPGTGKTETAYQIARLTDRGIMKLDISDTKSVWYGQSEKKIKSVFTKYRSAVKQSPVTPILFFNEADAIIGKRQELSAVRDRSIDQTENTIQNIILQEIEDLDGILIATTNLVINMDKAFERRFLYKIEFESPGIEARKSIWQTLIPDLPHDDVDCLANKFDFSGGQIENIARRRTVAEVLHGISPSLEKLIEYCSEEKLETSKDKKMGFTQL